MDDFEIYAGMPGPIETRHAGVAELRLNEKLLISELAKLESNAETACDLLKAMAHEARLKILCLLTVGERSVTELEKSLNLRQPAVSQQLARLKSDNIVTSRREGKMIFYSLASKEVRSMVHVLARCLRGS